MKTFLLFLGLAVSMIIPEVRAQETDDLSQLKISWRDTNTEEIIDYIPEISLDSRFWYKQDLSEKRGRFDGDGLYLNADGYISPNLSYSLQQRFASTYYTDDDLFNSTNWLMLIYELDSFEFAGGKLGVLAGGFENDYDDFDSYYDMNSMFYNLIDAFQWGISATWFPADNHSLTLQAINSPFYSEEINLYGFDLSWRMDNSFYESFWTANLWEYEEGKFAKNLSLGNRFFIGNFSLDLDFQARSADMKRILKDHVSIAAQPSYEFGEWGRIFGKFGWEKASEGIPFKLAYDEYLGQDYIFYGAGFEFFPLKENKDIRLHAAWSANNMGYNSLNIGLTWRFDITSAAKYLFCMK